MDYLTIDMVIKYLRLVDPPPGIIKVIEKCITMSEKAVYEILNRSYSDIIEEYGKIPKGIKIATLLMTEDFLRRKDDHVNYALKFVLERYKKN
jgi:hypothetical protein